MGKDRKRAKMADKYKINTYQMVNIFRSLFSGHPDAYGTYDLATGRARVEKARVTDNVIRAHLSGKQPYGVFLLVKDRTRAIAVDFDTKNRMPPADFVFRSKHYGISAYIERSKSKGYHCWIFFDELGALARKARLVVNHILEDIEEPDVEVFPKQDALDANVRFGNFINAPLFGRLAAKGKTVFIDPKTFKPYPDQWEVLGSVNRASESTLDEIIDLNNLSIPPSYHFTSCGSEKGNKGRFNLPPCARKILHDGVSQYQRVSCFRWPCISKDWDYHLMLQWLRLRYGLLKIILRSANGSSQNMKLLNKHPMLSEWTIVVMAVTQRLLGLSVTQDCPVNKLRKESRQKVSGFHRI